MLALCTLSAAAALALAVLLGAQGHGALAAGVAAEGPPVLSPLIGPAQEREALARRQHQHHLRHQHHYYGDPRLTGRHPALGVSADGGAAPPPPPPPERRAAPAGAGAGPDGACPLNVEQLASAVTKQLEGICNEKEIMDRFHNLGSQLADQFNVLKTMILNLEDKVGAMDIGMERAERRLLSAVSKARCGRGGSRAAEEEIGGAADTDQDEAAVPGAAAPEDDADEEGDADYGDNPALVTVPRDGAQGPSAREEEVQHYNGTVHTEYAPRDAAGAGAEEGAGLGNSLAGCGHGNRVFTYYWRVRNMDYKMTGWNHRRSLRSPSFYVWPGGYRMYLRIYPRQSGENVYVHVGLTRGEHDAALPWPFRLRHRLAVLDQVGSTASSASGPVDLVSRLWDPSQLCSGYNWQRPSAHTPDNYECVGLGFPQAVLRSRSYLRQDTALVKLTVCLNQP